MDFLESKSDGPQGLHLMILIILMKRALNRFHLFNDEII